jgi:predicted O-linked N-acetylglucosamine transferase (SPINDLY family)
MKRRLVETTENYLDSLLKRVEGLFDKIANTAQECFNPLMRLDDTELNLEIQVNEAENKFLEKLKEVFEAENKLITELRHVESFREQNHAVNNTNENNRVTIIENQIQILKIYKTEFEDAINKAGELLNEVSGIVNEEIKKSKPAQKTPPLILIQGKI